MRSRRYSSIHLALALGTALVLVGPFACSGNGSHSPAPEADGAEISGPTGTMTMALTARGQSGSIYRLRQAVFDVFRTGDVITFPPPIDPPPFPIPQPEPFPEPPSLPLIPADDVPSRPPIVLPPIDLPEEGPPVGSAGSVNSGGAGPIGTGGFAGGVAGSAGSAGMAGSGVGTGGSFTDPNELFFTTLFSESDPLATTLEATLPTGAFQITLFGGWFLEKVVNGAAVRVEANLLSPDVQQFQIAVNDETHVVYRFETNGEIVEFAEGRLVVDIEVEEREFTGNNARRALIETNPQALAGLTLRGTLDAALENSGAAITGVTAEDAYHAIIDSYATAGDGRGDGPHCDDETTNGVPSLNGFPLQCGRLEAEQFDNLDLWEPLAVVNRLDLAPADGANCGQQRLIFSNNAPIGNGRMFVIVEAVVPNPSPECGIDACRPIAEFWKSLETENSAAVRGARLREAFLSSGVGPFGPFMNSDRLGPNGGQIRTNNFNHFVWTLREFHFQAAPEVLPLPQPVAESPNGELWNDLVPLPQGEACREAFVASASALLGNNLSAMSFPVPQACKDAESPNDGFRGDYVGHLSNGSGELVDRLNEVGAPFGLTAFDIAARARFTGSCMGCHIEAGGSDLGNGLVAPFQNDFVQVSEFSTEDCGDGTTCFAVSPALRDIFLPHRAAVQDELLLRGGSCGGPTPGVDGGVAEPTPVEPPPFAEEGAPSGLPVRNEPARFTIGGQLVVPHGH